MKTYIKFISCAALLVGCMPDFKTAKEDNKPVVNTRFPCEADSKQVAQYRQLVELLQQQYQHDKPFDEMQKALQTADSMVAFQEQTPCVPRETGVVKAIISNAEDMKKALLTSQENNILTPEELEERMNYYNSLITKLQRLANAQATENDSASSWLPSFFDFSDKKQ